MKNDVKKEEYFMNDIIIRIKKEMIKDLQHTANYKK